MVTVEAIADYSSFGRAVGSASDGRGGKDRPRSRIRYDVGENLGDAAVAPIIHVHAVRRDESLE